MSDFENKANEPGQTDPSEVDSEQEGLSANNDNTIREEATPETARDPVGEPAATGRDDGGEGEPVEPQGETPQQKETPAPEQKEPPVSEPEKPSVPKSKEPPAPEQAQTEPEVTESAGAAPEKPVSTEGAETADDQPTVPPPPAAAGSVSLPGPEDDAELEAEIDQALGDMSLMDMYGLEESAPAAAPAKSPAAEIPVREPVGEAPPAPGVNRGKVISVEDDGVFVDLGGKSQGFLPSEEFEEGEKVEVGSEVDVAILRYDARDGLLILSRKTAEQQLLRRNLKEGTRVEARVVGHNKGGLEMDVKGLKAFMPASQISIYRTDDFESLLNERFVCEVIQVERGDKNIVLSRRNILEEEEARKREETWTQLEEGQLRHGVVRSIMDFGVFVDLGGVDGLVHVSELSWARVKHPRDILEVGQGIDVVIIGKDEQTQRIALSLRQAGGDPWTTAEQKYASGTRHRAQIVKLMNFGAFAELEPGVEGLIPISEMTWAGRVRHPSDVVQPGMMVEVEVLKLEVEKRKVSLSMKSLQDNPWSNVLEKYVVDHVYSGKVVRLTDFGAFVTLEPGVDGLIHISEMSDKHVKRAGEVVSEGEEVQVKVLKVDMDNQRIALSMKNLSGPEEKPEEAGPTAPEAPAKKKKERPRRGGLTW